MRRSSLLFLFLLAADRDGDGLSDELETGELAAMGANPDAPDIFIQMDWIACDPILEYCGPNNSFDQHRISSAAAVRLAEYFWPNIRVHIDNGLTPEPGLAAAVHGDWGGAAREAIGPHPCNPDKLGDRFGTFHRGLTSTLGSGGGGDMGGFCFGGDAVRMGVLAQEIGHNLGIGHGGNRDSYPANCKPHYRSPMNYAYTYDRALSQFSRGAFAGVPLDPTALDELAGLGTTDPLVLDMLTRSPWIYSVRADGAIDWNRDGRFDTSPVRGAPTWAYASCEQSVAHSDFFPPADEPTMAWLPDAAAPRLVVLARAREDGRLVERSASRFDMCDPFVEPESCTDFMPQPSDDWLQVPGALPGVGSPAVVGYRDTGGAAHLAVVYADADGHPFTQRLDAGGVWTAPVAVEDGVTLTGDPALALAPDGASLLLVASVAGELRRWQYTIADATWAPAGGAGVWEDGTSIIPCQGLALTRGYERGLAEMQIYAVIPQGLACTMELARWDAQADVWVRYGPGAWQGPAPLAGGRPGLAYVPFDPADPTEGRFYVAWRPFPAGAGLIALTEGNDPTAGAPDRRLIFWRGNFIRNLWAIVDGGISLGFDPAYDQNLRAAWNFIDRAVQFHPFTDGITAVSMRDQNDYVFLEQHLACSLTASCP